MAKNVVAKNVVAKKKNEVNISTKFKPFIIVDQDDIIYEHSTMEGAEKEVVEMVRTGDIHAEIAVYQRVALFKCATNAIRIL